MKALSTNFSERLRSSVVSLCHCWKIELEDGLVLGFTNHDDNLMVNGIEYHAHPGLNTPIIKQTLGFNVDSVDALGAIDHDLISQSDLRAGRYHNAKISLFAVDWQNTTETIFLMQGHVANIREHGDEFELEIRQITDALENKQGRYFSHMCDAQLGDHRCKVNATASPYGATAIITDIPSDSKILVSNLDDYDAGWFDFGEIRFDTIALSNQPMTIAQHRLVNGFAELTFWAPLPVLPSQGDSVFVIAGCNKLYATCQSKFNNQLNFQGFPHMPGKEYGIS